MGNQQKTTIKNRYGIPITVCCASCKFKELRNQYRYCGKGGKIPRPSFVCNQWQMDESYHNAGRGGGKIKTKSYLSFALDKLTNGYTENAARKRVSVNQIREEFLKNGGRIYSIED